MSGISTTESRFESQLRQVYETAYRYALRLERQPDDAMDLLQDSTVAAFRAYHQFTEGTNFRAWFLRILTNRFYARQRSGYLKREVEIDHVPDLSLYDQAKRLGHSVEGDNPAEALLQELNIEAVRKAIEALPEETRIACTLNLLDDLSYAEISEILGVPTGTIRVRVHRGRKALQKALWEIGMGRDPLAPQAEKEGDE